MQAAAAPAPAPGAPPLAPAPAPSDATLGALVDIERSTFLASLVARPAQAGSLPLRSPPMRPVSRSVQGFERCSPSSGDRVLLGWVLMRQGCVRVHKLLRGDNGRAQAPEETETLAQTLLPGYPAPSGAAAPGVAGAELLSALAPGALLRALAPDSAAKRLDLDLAGAELSHAVPAPAPGGALSNAVPAGAPAGGAARTPAGAVHISSVPVRGRGVPPWQAHSA